ncbi:helix-turn-helix domain-containing protein [Phyllobacterium sp. CCNWLW109]|uniref:helix-turn-helix domain-containing protein n=1 Tax=Phyllobacterium sp. CCNWLW109 TaxID=3127479 RepID=UPI003076CEAE
MTTFLPSPLLRKMAKYVKRNLLRAARIALDINHEEMAALAGVSRPTLTTIERSDANVGTRSIEKVEAALEREGIQFLTESDVFGPGFRLPIIKK